MEGFQEEETKNFEESYWADYLKKNGEGEDAGKEHSRQKKTMFKVGNGKWNAVFEELHNFPVAWHFPHESVIWEVRLGNKAEAGP